MVSDLKPSIFDDLKQNGGSKGSSYYSRDVRWFLEDENDKIELKNLPMNLLLCSGMVLGIRGRKGEKGAFNVESVHFPSKSEYAMDSLKRSKLEEYKILMVSNLEIGNEKRFVMVKEQLKYAMKNHKVLEIVLLGNIFMDKKCVFAKKIEEFLKKFNVKIITVPGPMDPTSSLHPQEAIHRRIFDFHNIENPGFIEINNRCMLLTSGSCVEDILKYKSNEMCNLQEDQTDYRMHWNQVKVDNTQLENNTGSFLNAMETILKCRISCPSAPDTLHAHSDVTNGFVIDKKIDYFVSGSGPEFGVRDDGNVRVMCLPKYSLKGQVFIIDLGSGENQIIELE